MNVDDFTDDDYAACLPFLSDEKRKRADRLSSPLSKKLTAAGDMLARSLAAELTGVKPENIQISADKNGKPYISNNLSVPVHISISHSGTFALAAASFRPVGADIEKIKTIKPKVARRYCSEAEYNFLLSDEKQFSRRAVLLWTMKEAYGKLCGGGVFRRDRFAAEIINGEPSLEYDTHRFDFPAAAEDYIICICEGC